MYSGVGSTPVPDPTQLTSLAVTKSEETLRRELDSAVKLLEAQAQGNREAVEARLRGMDEAVRLLQFWRDKQPVEIDSKIAQLEALVNERFSTVGQQFDGVKTEFKLRDDYTNRAEEARKEELKTALSSAEKAVDKQATAFEAATDKSGNATAELLRQQGELLKSTKEGLDSQVGDLKVRLATVEATASAAREAAATASANANAASTAASMRQRDEKVDQRGNSSLGLQVAAMGITLFFSIAALVIGVISLVDKARP